MAKSLSQSRNNLSHKGGGIKKCGKICMNKINKMIIIILIIIHIVGIKLAKKIKFHYKINNKKLMLNNY